MRLSGLVPLLDDLPEFRRLAEVAATATGDSGGAPSPNSSLITGGPLAGGSSLGSSAAVAVVREAAKPYLVAGLQRVCNRPIVLVAVDDARAQEWHHDLLAWSAGSASPGAGDGGRPVLHLPAYDALPFEQLPSVPEVVAARVATLIRLTDRPHPPAPSPDFELAAGGPAHSQSKIRGAAPADDPKPKMWGGGAEG